MKIFLLCQDIDLGYHVQSSFFKKEDAEKRLAEMIEKHYASGLKWHHHLFIEEMEIE